MSTRKVKVRILSDLADTENGMNYDEENSIKKIISKLEINKKFEVFVAMVCGDYICQKSQSKFISTG